MKFLTVTDRRDLDFIIRYLTNWANDVEVFDSQKEKIEQALELLTEVSQEIQHQA